MGSDDRSSFDSLIWQSQGEISRAVSTALLYGEIPQIRAHVWIYLDKAMPTFLWHSYYVDGTPNAFVTIEEALDVAVPCPAFQLATTPTKLEALVTYYFMRKNVAKNYELTLTLEQKRLLKVMIGDEPSSKIVKLRVRVPENYSLGHSLGHQDGHEPSPVISPSQRNRSRSRRPASQPSSPHSQMSIDAENNYSPRASSGTILLDPASLVAQFLELEDREVTLCNKLDRHNDELRDLKREAADIEKRTQTKLQAADLLIAQKDEGKVAKKRLWDKMSKKETWELGRHDSLIKRPKHD